jgi:hypothetical protein
MQASFIPKGCVRLLATAYFLTLSQNPRRRVEMLNYQQCLGQQAASRTISMISELRGCKHRL